MSGKSSKVSKKQAKKEDKEVVAAELEGDLPVDGLPEEPPADEPEKEPEPAKRFAEVDPRNSIYSKAKTVQTGKNEADFETLDDDGKVMAIKMEMESGGEPDEAILLRLHNEGYVPLDDDELSRINEALGIEPEPKPQKPEKPKKSASSDNSDEGVDADSDMVTIRVDGEDRLVKRSEVEKAGIATLQKERNADRRQQDLSQAEQRFADYEKRVRENFARGLDANGNPLTTSAKEQGLPDETGADLLEAVKEKVAAVRKATFEGDDEAMETALLEAITSVAGRQGPTQPLDIDELVDRAAERLDERNQQRTAATVAETVNTTFRTDYSDLYEDDRGFALAKAEFDRLRAAEPHSDPVALMRKAGDEIRELLTPKPTASLDETLAKRREAAARTAQQAPPAGSQRKPGPKPAEKPISRSEVVANMRRARGAPT